MDHPGGGYDQQFPVIPGAQIAQQQYYNQQQAPMPPPGMVPLPPPAAGFPMQPAPIVAQHFLAPPPFFPNQEQQHPLYGHVPPPPPPPPHQYAMHHHMYTEITQPNLPPPPAHQHQHGHFPPRHPQPPPPFQRGVASPPANQPPQPRDSQNGQQVSRNASPTPLPSKYPPTQRPPAHPTEDTVKSESRLLEEFSKAEQALNAMFPQLNTHIQSMILRLVLEDLVTAQKKHDDSSSNSSTAHYEAIDSRIVLDALFTISSHPQSSPAICYQKLVSLKESYLNGEPFQLVDAHVVRYWHPSGNEKLLGFRDYPWFAKESQQTIASAAQELALLLPSALKPQNLEPILEKWRNQPNDGWLEIDTVAVQRKINYAKLVEPPRALSNFASTGAARELATSSLQKLDITCALLSEDGQHNGLGELYLYGDADFGVQTIINPSSSNEIPTAVHPTELLNAMLTTGTTTAPTATTADGVAGLSLQANALDFRHLTLERSASTQSSDDADGGSIWLLGGFAAPQLPLTFTTIDSGRSFWSDRGNSVVKLDHGQQHDLTIALCRLNSAERSGESGVLQQALVVFIAASASSKTYSELARIQGASFVDVYSNYNGRKRKKKKNLVENLVKNEEIAAFGMAEIEIDEDDNDGGGGGSGSSGDGSINGNDVDGHKTTNKTGQGTKPVATLGSPTFPNEKPFYRVFACARRVSVALVDANQLTATSQLSVDAKPFIPPKWKRAFDAQPAACFADFSATTKELLMVDVDGDRALVSAASKKSWATRTHQAKIMKTSTSNTTNKVDNNYNFSHPLLRRYHRLLHLEELAKEQDICRHDFYNAQLHFAVFAHSNQRKFAEIHLPDPNAPAGSNRTAVKISKSMYRGPSVDHIFETPLFQKYKDGTGSSDNDVYVLGMIKHAGLSEGRPAVCIGDAVHLRPINPSDIEIVCLVASIDGDVMFLVMPQAFWRTFASLENALCLRAVQLPAGGGSSSSLKTATVLKGMPKGAFSGKVHVRFSFDRRPFVHMQTALRAADLKMNSNVCLVPPVLSGSENLIANMRYLQPTLAQVREIESKVEVLCGRSGLPLNAEQRHAVSAVLAGGGRQTPYALHGPPGTGKTVTMVSAALQLLSTYPEARLLLCAPQNYSADLLCSALATAGLLKTQVLRLNDPRRPPYSAKEDTLDYTLLNTTSGLFELPQSLRQLKSFSVVVCTCTAAALMYPYYDPHFSGPEASAFSSPRVGFSHVLIDESGQALLPEALIPLVLLSPPPPLDLFLDNNNNNITTTTNETLSSAAHSNNTNHLSPAWGAMLCGDPKQLGPTVHSLAASASGLSSSLLEHLIAAHWESSAPMLNAGLVPSTSMLLANYRSHASLLNLPSKLFYRGQLLAAADPDSVLAPQWKETQRSQPLPGEEMWIVEEEVVDENIDNEDEFSQTTTSASLMFYGVRGQQMRESDIPSYHNPLEAAAVADLVAGLLESKNAGVSLSDVGVMATYRRQVTTLRLLLRQRGLGQVRVGTVDDYQGQEERIIFISTVFSTVPHHAVGQQKGQQQGDDQSNDGGDAQYVGLWNNPKRFNVAITRAKALLVVVGHPAVLLEDPSWKELLRHCASIGAVRGAGASALAERLGMDLGSSGLDFIDNYEIGNGHSEEHVDSVEMAKAIDQMASLALLGAGDQAQMFPETLEEAYASYADEMEWRIML